ncbi:hypothetical protein [Actinoallomurus sp. NPDC050550]|uniref:hypothetical protein n=1 Tax=Actinoallomurus sp. NPDC050550 TaxID=3154937 RepID=UPI00340D32B1
MGAELRTSLEEPMEDHSRQVERPKVMRRALDRVSTTATRRDGLLTAVVGPRGLVQDVRLDPNACRRPTPSEPSRRMAAKNYQQAEHPRAIHGHASTMRM